MCKIKLLLSGIRIYLYTVLLSVLNSLIVFLVKRSNVPPYPVVRLARLTESVRERTDKSKKEYAYLIFRLIYDKGYYN